MKRKSTGKKKRREYRRPPKAPARRRRASVAPPVRSRGAAKEANPGGRGKSHGKSKGSGPKRRKVPVLQRLSRVSARTVILVILMIFFIAFAVGPVSRNLEATSRLKKKEVELEKQRAATESLEKEVEEARSLDYVEREARRQRMVAPGEVLYLITPEESELEVEYRVKNLQSMDEAWERVRRMLKCTPPGSEAGE